MSADAVAEKYGNLFDMYERITGENGYERPMRIYPAVHYTMGGLWVDYDLMSNIPGLFVTRRGQLLRPRRQPPRRTALMQGLADGYFVIPYTLAQLPRARPRSRQLDETHEAVAEARAGGCPACQKLLSHQGQTARSTPSTASSATSCGRTAAWPAPRRA